MSRYHPFLVVLHWLLAILIIAAFFVGAAVLDDMPNSDPNKINILKMHMVAGMLVLTLMILRIFVRKGTEVPPHAETGNALLNRLGQWAHVALYVVVIAMCLTGMGAMAQGELNLVIFGDGDPVLPANYDEVPALGMHEAIGFVLMLLVVAHLAASLFHQLVLKDRLFRRMWFGKRQND